jgi:hypothetical protein
MDIRRQEVQIKKLISALISEEHSIQRQNQDQLSHFKPPNAPSTTVSKHHSYGFANRDR